MRMTTSDLPLRLATFEWLEEQSAIHGEVLPWSVLLAGFVHEGVRVPLVSMQGIFTPRAGRLPLTIRTAVGGPYADAFAANGLLLYKYRGTDPFHRDNEGLRQAMRERAPLVYLHGHREGRYHAIWPGFIVGDSPAGRAAPEFPDPCDAPRATCRTAASRGIFVLPPATGFRIGMRWRRITRAWC